MKQLFIVTLILLGFSAQNLYAQDDWAKGEIRWIKRDYQKSDVVAAVKITEQKLSNTFGNSAPNYKGYVEYLVKGKVINSYKGKFRDGADISFYRVVEGLREGQLLREEIYFLTFGNKRKNDLFEVEDNSNRPLRNEFDSALVELKKTRTKYLAARQTIAEKQQILQAILDHKNFVEDKLFRDKLARETASEKITPPLRILANSVAARHRLSSANLTFDGKKVPFVRKRKTKSPPRNLIEIKEFLLQDETNFYVSFVMESEAKFAAYRFWRVNGNWEIVDYEVSPTGH